MPPEPWSEDTEMFDLVVWVAQTLIEPRWGSGDRQYRRLTNEVVEAPAPHIGYSFGINWAACRAFALLFPSCPKFVAFFG